MYVKRNVLEGNKAVKKAVAKVLAYLAVASILSFINSVIPSANPAIQTLDDIASVVAVNYILRLVVNVPAIATPIVAIILLKPIRVAMKTMHEEESVLRFPYKSSGSSTCKHAVDRQQINLRQTLILHEYLIIINCMHAQ